MCNKWLYVATNFANENQSGLLPKTNNFKNISPYDWHYLMVGSDNLFRMQRMSGTHLSPGRNRHNKPLNLRTVSSHQKQVSEKFIILPYPNKYPSKKRPPGLFLYIIV